MAGCKTNFLRDVRNPENKVYIRHYEHVEGRRGRQPVTSWRRVTKAKAKEMTIDWKRSLPFPEHPKAVDYCTGKDDRRWLQFFGPGYRPMNETERKELNKYIKTGVLKPEYEYLLGEKNQKGKIRVFIEGHWGEILDAGIHGKLEKEFEVKVVKKSAWEH